jgi:hypothetical protein
MFFSCPQKVVAKRFTLLNDLLGATHMLMKNQSVDTKIEFTIIALLANCKCIKLQYLSLL